MDENLLKGLGDWWGWFHNSKFTGDRPGDIKHCSSDSRKAEELLSLRPKVSLGAIEVGRIALE